MENDAFDRWCITAQSDVKMDDGHPLPLLTIFLHVVCDSDEERFERGVPLLRAAFDAGAEQERKSPTQNAVGEVEGEK